MSVIECLGIAVDHWFQRQLTPKTDRERLEVDLVKQDLEAQRNRISRRQVAQERPLQSSIIDPGSIIEWAMNHRPTDNRPEE